MRYEKGHKEATRQKIIETAAAEFRRHGIDGIGLADLMAKTGLTHGGFYSHFKSKEDLVLASLEDALNKSRLRKIAEEGGSLEDMIRWYLRPEHRDNPEKGCAAASLIAELARHSVKTRTLFTERFKTLMALIESKLPEEIQDRPKRALAVFAMMMGSLQLSRTISDPELSNQVIEAGIETALTLIKK